MKRILALTMFCCTLLCARAQKPQLRGQITDKLSNAVLGGASVVLKGTKMGVSSANDGSFYFPELNAGQNILVISHVGYQTTELSVSVQSSGITIANVGLLLDERNGSEVVISASKRAEKIVQAPASIQVIGSKQIARFAGSNVGELLAYVQGLEYTRNGVADLTVNARGFHSAFNNKVFQLVDGRNSMAALSGSLAVMNRGTIIKEDIERIEVVLGPQSALYGPNAHNAVINFISKDPRKYPGTSVSVGGGNQSQFNARFRQADVINKKFAYKITGEYAAGKEFEFYDSVYAGNQTGGTPQFGPPVAIPERNVDFNFNHLRGEAHIYYSITPKADIVVSGGSSINNWLQITTAGRNQMRDVSYSFLQAKFVHPRFFVNIYNTWGSIGNSYIIGNYTRDFWNRTHSTAQSGPTRYLPSDSAEMNAMRIGRLKERSQRFNAELQYNYHFQEAGLFLVAGLNHQQDRPNGYGLNLVDSFQRIRVAQNGAVLQLEKTLPWQLRFISASRYDHHKNLGGFFAQKLAMVKKIVDAELRITWGRAYAMPSILNQYARVARVLYGNGQGVFYIPNGTNIYDTALFKTTDPLKAEQVSTWEIGYKGSISDKFFVDVSFYSGRTKNFISPPRTVAGRALRVNGQNVYPLNAGNISGDTLKAAGFSTFFNYGEVKAYGIDAGLTYSINKFLTISLKYSWFGSDITRNNIKNDANKDNFVSLEEQSLNAPRNRALLMLNANNLCKEKLFINLSARYVQQYDFYSGTQVSTEAGEGERGRVYWGKNPANGQDLYYLKNFDWGPLGNFVSIDLAAGYRFNQMIRMNMGVNNLLNSKQMEFVGAPSIRRLIMLELAFSF